MQLALVTHNEAVEKVCSWPHRAVNQLNNHRLKPVGLNYGLKVRIRVD